MNQLVKLSTESAGEISTAALIGALGDHAGKPLVFTYGGRDIRAGYHVTEVKSGRFDALDCGGNPEEWRETFVQLWDIPAEPGRDLMRAGKFVAIMRKVADRVAYDGEAKLTFEVSDGSSPIQILRATSIEAGRDTVRIELGPRPSSCKPRDRWLEEDAPRASAPCSGVKGQAQACCG
jgi:hypothetical protein